ncbi:hypothetical protein HAV15_004352 [Penicillium sp. str. |nr:hypothetical protein HAV15_004352 [Penicillium sp. str. \
MNLYAAGDPERASQLPISPPLAGVIYLSVPFWYDRTKPMRQKTIRSYYGSDAEDVWGKLSEDTRVLGIRRVGSITKQTFWDTACVSCAEKAQPSKQYLVNWDRGHRAR